MTIPQLIGFIAAIVGALVLLAIVSRINDRRRIDRYEPKSEMDIWNTR